jgi:hypothetical protein
LDPSFLGTGNTVKIGGSSPLIAGELVNLYETSGTLYAQPAYAATGAGQFLAQGFVTEAGSVGATVPLYYTGVSNYIDTLSEFSSGDVGAVVYLSSVLPGAITKTPPFSVATITEIAWASNVITVTANNSLGVGTYVHFTGLSLTAAAAVLNGNYYPVASSTSTTFTIHTAISGIQTTTPETGSASQPVVLDQAVGYVVAVVGSTVTVLFNFAFPSHSIMISDLFGGINASSSTVLFGDGTWRPPVNSYLIDVKNFGAKGSGKFAQNGHIFGTLNALTLATPSLNVFSANDVGATILVRGAGTAGADLWTTISAYSNPHAVTLTDPAGTDAFIADIYWGMVDDTAAITAAINSISSNSAATLYAPAGVYMYSALLPNNYNLAGITGDGPYATVFLAANSTPAGFIDCSPLSPFTLSDCQVSGPGDTASISYTAEISLHGSGVIENFQLTHTPAEFSTDNYVTALSETLSSVVWTIDQAIFPSFNTYSPTSTINLRYFVTNSVATLGWSISDALEAEFTNCIAGLPGTTIPRGFIIAASKLATVRNCSIAASSITGSGSFIFDTPTSLTLEGCESLATLPSFGYAFYISGWNMHLRNLHATNCDIGLFIASTTNLTVKGNILVENCRMEPTATSHSVGYDLQNTPQDPPSGMTFINCSTSGMGDPGGIPFSVGQNGPFTLIGCFAETGSQTNDVVTGNAPTIIAIDCSFPANYNIVGTVVPNVQGVQVVGPFATTVLSSLATTSTSGFATAIKEVSSDYPVTILDGTIECNGTLTVTLPTTGLMLGQTFRIKNIGSGTVTVTSAVNIDDALTQYLTVHNDSFDVQWNGTQYIIL